jgi:NADPH-dependent curcumin reductase CurA
VTPETLNNLPGDPTFNQVLVQGLGGNDSIVVDPTVMLPVVIDGGAVVQLVDGPSVELTRGDVVIFPNGDAHHMSSGQGATRPFPNYGITAKIIAKILGKPSQRALGRIVSLGLIKMDETVIKKVDVIWEQLGIG